MLGIRRRDFITLLGGAAAWPLAARAQQRTLPTVGLLFSGTPETNGDEVTALRRGMSETGFVEGRNVAVEYRWGAPLSALDLAAADLVNRRVTVIAANTAGAALRAKARAWAQDRLVARPFAAAETHSGGCS
jgi:putative ABC transport system substrate-binding protein